MPEGGATVSSGSSGFLQRKGVQGAFAIRPVQTIDSEGGGFSTPANGNAEQDIRTLAEWVHNELELVAKAMQKPTLLHLEELFESPPRPRDGIVVFADGSEWNPGSGRGYYGYHSSAWHFLG